MTNHLPFGNVHSKLSYLSKIFELIFNNDPFLTRILEDFVDKRLMNVWDDKTTRYGVFDKDMSKFLHFHIQITCFTFQVPTVFFIMVFNRFVILLRDKK